MVTGSPSLSSPCSSSVTGDTGLCSSLKTWTEKRRTCLKSLLDSDVQQKCSEESQPPRDPEQPHLEAWSCCLLFCPQLSSEWSSFQNPDSVQKERTSTYICECAFGDEAITHWHRCLEIPTRSQFEGEQTWV